MHQSQDALHIAVQLQRMLDGVGSGSMNILGVFNMLWHNCPVRRYVDHKS